MREWQAGDPIGDGNDIGVPDIPYMDYLKGKESCNSELVDYFKSKMNHARYLFYKEKFVDAFIYLNMASKEYLKMNGHEQSQISEKPFTRDWIIELCCRIVNMKGEQYHNALGIIRDHRLHVNLCMDCDCIYPPDYMRCIRCGKPLERPFEKTPEQIVGIIPDAVAASVYYPHQIDDLVSRSLKLMKSNDCRLVKIEEGFSGIDFYFEKNHKYFTTTYTCEFIPSGGLRIFEDFSTSHDHGRLLEDEKFQKLIKDTENKTGFKFIEVTGGYGYDFDENRIDFIFTDKIRIYVRFDIGENITAVYNLDLDKMKLSDEYDVF